MRLRCRASRALRQPIGGLLEAAQDGGGDGSERNGRQQGRSKDERDSGNGDADSLFVGLQMAVFAARADDDERGEDRRCEQGDDPEQPLRQLAHVWRAAHLD